MPSYARGFPYGIRGNVLNIDHLVSVHFNHLSLYRVFKKQVFYALIQRYVRPRMGINQTVDWVVKPLSEEGIVLTAMKPQWLWSQYLHLIELS